MLLFLWLLLFVEGFGAADVFAGKPARIQPLSEIISELVNSSKGDPTGMSRIDSTYMFFYPNETRKVFRIGPGAKNEVIGATLLDAVLSEIQAPATSLFEVPADSNSFHFPVRLKSRVGSLQDWEGRRIDDFLRRAILNQFNAVYLGLSDDWGTTTQASTLSRVPLAVQLAFFLTGNFDVTENNVIVIAPVLDNQALLRGASHSGGGLAPVLDNQALLRGASHSGGGLAPVFKVVDFEHIRTPVRWLLDDLPWVAWGKYHPELGWGRGQFPRAQVRRFNVTQAVVQSPDFRPASEDKDAMWPSALFFANLSRQLEDDDPWFAISGEKLAYLWSQRHRAPVIHYVKWKRALWVRWPLSLSPARHREAMNLKQDHGVRNRTFLLSPYINTRFWGIDHQSFLPPPTSLFALHNLVFNEQAQESLFKRLKAISGTYSVDHFHSFLHRAHQVVTAAIAASPRLFSK